MNPNLLRLLCVCVACIGMLPSIVTAETSYYISLGPGDTAGESLVINAGDSVTWETYSDDSDFDVESDYNFWNGGDVNDYDDGMGDQISRPFGVTFPYGGSYPYTVNGDADESGTITVIGNYLSPPTLKVISPTNNLTFIAPVQVIIRFQGTASGPVGFGVVAGYVDGTLQGYSQQGIRELAITNNWYFDFETDQMGTHTVRLVAIDGTGGMSNPIEFPVTIVASLPLIDSPQTVGGKFVFHATNLASGESAIVQSTASLNAALVNWVPVSTNPITASSAFFTNNLSAATHYFRVLQR